MVRRFSVVCVAIHEVTRRGNHALVGFSEGLPGSSPETAYYKSHVGSTAGGVCGPLNWFVGRSWIDRRFGHTGTNLCAQVDNTPCGTEASASCSISSVPSRLSAGG
eukprot:gnl/TRDRNA2_/TRDRNA2_190134_c0_seq1.p2 gnl/TRDRNA2_/TRDRNA2_190134_c0~~gnl/TRDRNA2_/TRDRNA2_190134_c0_seq1.p2  ORF type:complete len:106 (-),score=2.47 gnl/TRDRNA2_/TRDRNA2_190134_c0_seq1:80-397(-)